jgi:hypothetical protein
MLTIFCLDFFGQFSSKVLFLSKEDRVKLAYFFYLIFKNLGLHHPLYGLQELIFVLRVFNLCLHKEKTRSMLGRCSKGGCQALTSIWAEIVFRLE